MSREKKKDHNLKAVPKYEPNVDDSQERLDECPLCFGTGMEVVAGKGARKCSCRFEFSRVSDPLMNARVPDHFRECDFDTYIIPDVSKERARQKSLEFASRFPEVKQGLLIKGPNGVGKTHLAVSIIKGILRRKAGSVLFYEFGQLLTEIRDSYDPKSASSELSVLSPIFTVDLLVLDEFAATNVSDWVRDTMTQIISARYNNRKLTVITTNFRDEDELLKEAKVQFEARQKKPVNPNAFIHEDQERNLYLFQQEYLGREETLQKRIGYRLRSRLYEMCQEIYVGGQDMRELARKRSSIV